jgi:carbamoyl-phosphate synthase small subunit
LRVTHKSLFDGSLQGIARVDRNAFSFQGHPEASPGPHDAAPLFDHFIELITARAGGHPVAGYTAESRDTGKS